MSARGHADELSLARGESEDRSKSLFPREGRAITAQDIAQRAAARRLVVGPAGIGKAKELATLQRGFKLTVCAHHVSLRCLTPLR